MTRGNSIFLSRRASASTCPTARASDRRAFGDAFFVPFFLGEMSVLVSLSKKKGCWLRGGYFMKMRVMGHIAFWVNKLYGQKRFGERERG